MDINIFIDTFCSKNNLDVDKIKSNFKKHPYSDYRRMLIFFLREKALTLNEIKKHLNKKSHSSIIAALNVHDNYIKYNKKYKELYIKVLEYGI